MKGTVSGIIKPFGMQSRKDGTTYGPAVLLEVELENGEVSSILAWDEKAIGDSLTVEKNGEYWRLAKPAKAVNVDFEPVLKAMRELFKQNNEIIEGVHKLLVVDETSTPRKSGYQKAKEVAESLGGKVATPPDEVPIDAYDNFDQEEINLDDIPF